MSNDNILKRFMDTGQSRLDICKTCPELLRFTKQCKKCGCFLPAKVLLSNSKCPIGKW